MTNLYHLTKEDKKILTKKQTNLFKSCLKEYGEIPEEAIEIANKIQHRYLSQIPEYEGLVLFEETNATYTKALENAYKSLR